MKNKTLLLSPRSKGERCPQDGVGALIKTWFLFFVLLYALCSMPVLAQAKNTISADGTTSPRFYVGKDTTARFSIGMLQSMAIPLPFTMGDSMAMGSRTFVSGWQAGSGWQLSVDSAKRYRWTVDDITVRGTLSVYELLLNQIRATNGNLLVTSSGTVDSAAADQHSFWAVDVTENNISPFHPGDIIISQGANIAGATFDSTGIIINDGFLVKRLIFKVDSTNGRRVYVSVPADAPAQKGSIRPGDVFCRIGNASTASRMGTIGLFADEGHSPYLRVTDSVKSWTDWGDISSVRMQAGKLTGIYDPDFGGQLEGYGLYATNAYIKGKIVVTNPEDFNIDLTMIWDSVTNKPAYFNAPSGKGLFISADNMGYYNTTDYPADPWRTYMDKFGRFYLKGKGTHYLSWTDSVLTINGNVTLTNTLPVEKVTGLGDLAYEDELGLDDIGDGTTYARVLKTDISAGHIKLSEAIGTLDDIDNGTYGKLLSTEISAGHILIKGSDNSTTVISGGKIQAQSIKGSEIAAGTILTSNLAFSPATNQNVIAYINASNEGLDISADRISISGTTTFASGYNPYNKLDPGDAAADINANTTTIDGGKITTGTIAANKIVSGSFVATGGAAGDINSGSTTIDGGKITTGTITADRLVSNFAFTNMLTVSGGLRTGSVGAKRIEMDAGATTANLTFINGSPNAYNCTMETTSSGMSISSSSSYPLNITGDMKINGNLKQINGVTTSFPSSQGTAGSFLRNDGSGNLTWSNISIGSSSTTTLYVASTPGGAATTQLHVRTVNINGTNYTILVP
jgi:hypothetical protein